MGYCNEWFLAGKRVICCGLFLLLSTPLPLSAITLLFFSTSFCLHDATSMGECLHPGGISSKRRNGTDGAGMKSREIPEMI